MSEVIFRGGTILTVDAQQREGRLSHDAVLAPQNTLGVHEVGEPLSLRVGHEVVHLRNLAASGDAEHDHG